MKKLTIITSLVLCFSLFSGCAVTKQDQKKQAFYQAPREICSEYLDAVSNATADTFAMKSVRELLNCYVSKETIAPMDLEERLEVALKANPFPGTRRRSEEIIKNFFDKKVLKKLPEMRREMDSYISMLDDQSLVAQAQGDIKFAEAAEKRAKSLTTLRRIIDQISSSD